MTIKLHECFQLVASSQTTARCGKATPTIAELWNVFQRSAPNRTLVRKPRQGGQRKREGTTLSHGGAVECIPTLYAQQGILQSVASSYSSARMANRNPENMESSAYVQSTGRGCVNDGNHTIIIIMSVAKKCPVDFFPQIRSMNVFPHEKKVDIGVLPRVEASSRFRRPAQTYRLPNRSLVRKTRQGFCSH